MKVLSEHQANTPLDLGFVANEVMRTTHYCTNAQPTARLVPRQRAVMAAVVRPYLRELTRLDQLDMRTPHLGEQRPAVQPLHRRCRLLLPAASSDDPAGLYYALLVLPLDLLHILLLTWGCCLLSV